MRMKVPEVPDVELVRRLRTDEFLTLRSSEREVYIGSLVLGSMDRGNLARYLNITRSTVANHHEAMYRKLDCTSGSQLLATVFDAIKDESFTDAHINSELRVIGGKPHSQIHITPRQIEVIDTTVKSGSTKVAASELGIATSTVRNLLATAYDNFYVEGPRLLPTAYLTLRKLDILPIGVHPIPYAEQLDLQLDCTY